jgi:hypothetical protein
MNADTDYFAEGNQERDSSFDGYIPCWSLLFRVEVASFIRVHPRSSAVSPHIRG